MNILDIINILYIILILFIIYRRFKLPMLIMTILFLHFLMIFLTNDFLFNISYMPDQLGYLQGAKLIREFELPNLSNSVIVSSIFFGLFPIPFIESVYSISMINFLCYVMLYLFLLKKNILNCKYSHYFYLFYPSLCLYSSVALRDMLILSLMCLYMYYLIIEKKPILFAVFSIFLMSIKVQNFVILLVSYIGNVVFFKNTSIKEVKSYFLLFLLLLFLFFLIINGWVSFDVFVSKQQEMFYDNNNILNFIEFNGIIDYFLYAIPIMINFLLTPFTFKNIFQLFQFIENIIIICILCQIMFYNFKKKLFHIIEVRYLNIFFIFGILIYGFVVGNPGTAVRYKFPIITLYIIYSIYFIHIHQVKSK